MYILFMVKLLGKTYMTLNCICFNKMPNASSNKIDDFK